MQKSLVEKNKGRGRPGGDDTIRSACQSVAIRTVLEANHELVYQIRVNI